MADALPRNSVSVPAIGIAQNATSTIATTTQLSHPDPTSIGLLVAINPFAFPSLVSLRSVRR
jgi:hypothetical protein